MCKNVSTNISLKSKFLEDKNHDNLLDIEKVSINVDSAATLKNCTFLEILTYSVAVNQWPKMKLMTLPASAIVCQIQIPLSVLNCCAAFFKFKKPFLKVNTYSIFFFCSGASKPNTNPNGDSKPMNSVLNAAQSAQRREGMTIFYNENLTRIFENFL